MKLFGFDFVFVVLLVIRSSWSLLIVIESRSGFVFDVNATDEDDWLEVEDEDDELMKLRVGDEEEGEASI